jgi:hypothetical protein
MILSLFFIISIQANAWIGEARALFFRFGDEGCPAAALYESLLIQNDNNQPLYKAYLGTALATSAGCATSPIAKLRRFREGRILIEEAITKDPKHPEIRLLRLSVQSNTPSFLNYASEIESDRRILLKSIQEEDQMWDDNDFKLKVLNFVLEYTKPEAEELSLINIMISGR